MKPVPQSPTVPEPLMTADEVAARLGISIHTLNAWRVKRVHLQFVPVGRSVRYRAADVEAFIESRIRKVGAVA